jgi:predicted transposase
MKQLLTLVVKLQATPLERQLLDDTAKAFADACNYINQNVKASLTNRNSIQAVCYQDVKERFGLTANHVVRACARVGANRLTAKHKRKVRTNGRSPVQEFKSTSFDCDTRTFRFIEDGYLASISTTGKRVKIPMRVSNYHIGKLKGQNPTSAQVCQHKDGDWYVHIQQRSQANSIHRCY